MIRNCLFLSATALLLIVFGLANRLEFLAPWKRLYSFIAAPVSLSFWGSWG